MNPSKPPLNIDGQHNAQHAFMDLITAKTVTLHAIADGEAKAERESK